MNGVEFFTVPAGARISFDWEVLEPTRTDPLAFESTPPARRKRVAWYLFRRLFPRR